ncbi:MAG: tol-pal system protein YbgF [Flammeovirgaceae bacterium]|nr:tol-pal system protein YbgF [Flammeovirgaceae bacterium]
MKIKAFFFLLLIFLSCQAHAQRLPSLDSVKILLTNMTIQIECTSGVNDLYNFKFDRAASQFNWLRRNYPRHPLPYFLLGLIEWWKIQPNTSNTQYDEKFLSYMDTSIYFAEEIFDKDENNPEAAFFLAGAYGFKGRLYSDRKSLTKAAFAGKKSLNYLEYSKKHSDLSPELLFGDGIFNYYSVWIRDNYPMLKPILLFFDKGDKELGLEQLETVVKEAFYTKVEAQNFLMRIYSFEENQPHKGFRIAQYLHASFPDNPYFHRYYARMLYSMGRYNDLQAVSEDILNKIESKMVGYEEKSGRYASYYLGHVYRVKYKDQDKASLFFLKAVTFSEAIEELESGYYLYSLAHLGKIANANEEMDLAMSYYDKILVNADKKHSTYKEAKNFRKDYRKYLKAEKRKS